MDPYGGVDGTATCHAYQDDIKHEDGRGRFLLKMQWQWLLLPPGPLRRAAFSSREVTSASGQEGGGLTIFGVAPQRRAEEEHLRHYKRVRHKGSRRCMAIAWQYHGKEIEKHGNTAAVAWQ